MSTLPSVPYLKKGALIQGTQIVPFQYVPETLSRSLSANAFEEGGPTGLHRVKGPPQETITLDILLDATDQLERGKGLLSGLGIYPSLAALELMLYPNAAVVLTNAALSAIGLIPLMVSKQLFTLLVWGPMRIVPVQIDAMTINEEQFDSALTPLRAHVNVTLRVLTYADMGLLSLGGMLSYAGHVEKTVLSAMGSAGSVKSLAGNISSGFSSATDFAASGASQLTSAVGGGISDIVDSVTGAVSSVISDAIKDVAKL
jgi:hypothetical protein